ncbi:metallophosphoesterase [Amphritea sp. 1_MG-2023]|uniref:metallophosphoesterase n=1 Tax=Amphritea sp. 1_MG-2023 TaxID=3062670 RepID=UPI0026E1BF73|nr:metallophosphoesterase [Amphritea sp. 1_MG-2023]MDO6562589.1 metallophosphoesterase [Amphritea sp. 1_MG-2023]
MVSAYQGYDLIGDVHGCALSLKLLLHKLGYRRQKGIYQHPHRQAIFLGDIVDRGPRIREALHIVRDMVDAGHAQIVMGNHEFNYLSYLTPGLPGSGMPYLRVHNQRHQRILNATLEQLANYPQEQKEFLQWIKGMPLFLDDDQFRVVHACWSAQHIQRFIDTQGGNQIDDNYLHRSAHEGTLEWETMDRLLRGTHLKLPNDEMMVSKDGYKRRFFRTKFWAEKPEYYVDVVFQPDPLPEHVARRRLSSQDYQDLLYYGVDEPLLFIGHYWCDGEPKPLARNIACIDYSAVKFGKLVAYRLDQETTIDPKKFIWVDVLKEINDAI